MVIKELIERVLTGYSKGVSSDDVRLSHPYIYNKLLSSRNRLVSQQRKKNQKVSQWTYQTLNCVELVKAAMHECPCLPPAGCTIYRTKYPLPKALNDYDHHQIQSVSTVDGSVQFDEITWEEKKYRGSSKYFAAKPDYYIRNGHIYITQRTGPTMIAITGLWEEPLDAYSYPSKCNDCEGEECNDCISPLDRDFPIDPGDVDTVVGMTINEIANYFSAGREDKSNDNQSEQEPNG